MRADEINPMGRETEQVVDKAWGVSTGPPGPIAVTSGSTCTALRPSGNVRDYPPRKRASSELLRTFATSIGR